MLHIARRMIVEIIETDFAPRNDLTMLRQPDQFIQMSLCYFLCFVGETGEDWAAFGADGGGHDHTVGFDATEFARREVDDDGDFAADELLRLVELRDAGANLANLRADIHRKLQQLVRADDAFGGL